MRSGPQIVRLAGKPVTCQAAPRSWDVWHKLCFLPLQTDRFQSENCSAKTPKQELATSGMLAVALWRHVCNREGNRYEEKQVEGFPYAAVTFRKNVKLVLSGYRQKYVPGNGWIYSGINPPSPGPHTRNRMQTPKIKIKNLFNRKSKLYSIFWDKSPCSTLKVSWRLKENAAFGFMAEK
jgi:hypothetical protein